MTHLNCVRLAQVKHLAAGELQHNQLATALMLICNRQQQLQVPFMLLLTAYKHSSSTGSSDWEQDGSCASEQWWRLMQTSAARGHAAYIQELVVAMPAGAVVSEGDAQLLQSGHA